jgi:hypothetical protein
MLPVSPESGHQFLPALAATVFLRARTDDVSPGSARRSSVGASERPLQPVDVATGKQMPEPRDARFAFASLYALLLPDRLHSSAGGYEESQVL